MDEVVTLASESVQVQYCSDHYNELTFALLERQLGEKIAQSQEELIEKLVAGQMDPCLEASSAITSAAISMFGAEAVLEVDGCPVCAFHNIITHVADHIAVKYRGTN